MVKPYLIYVNGQLAKRRKTLAFALKNKRELEARGYKVVTVAYSIQDINASLVPKANG